MKGQGGNTLYSIILMFEHPRLLFTIWSNLLFSLLVKIGGLNLITAFSKILLFHSIKRSYYYIYTYFNIVEWSLFWTSDEFNILRFALDATALYIPACHLHSINSCLSFTTTMFPYLKSSHFCPLFPKLSYQVFSILSCNGLTLAGPRCPPSPSIIPQQDRGEKTRWKTTSGLNIFSASPKNSIYLGNLLQWSALLLSLFVKITKILTILISVKSK